MSRRRLTIGMTVGALTLGFGTAPAQATHPERTRCNPTRSHTIVATQTGRIYSRDAGDFARVYGCIYSQNRPRFLGEDGDCDPGPVVSRLILIGRYVGYVESACNIDSSTDTVVVRDLKTNRVKVEAIGATKPGHTADEPSVLVTDLAMSRSGAVAWIADFDAVGGNDDPNPNDDRQVRKFEPGDPEGGVLLDSGLAIEKRSLGIGSRTSTGYQWVYWTKSDSSFAAKLR